MEKHSVEDLSNHLDKISKLKETEHRLYLKHGEHGPAKTADKRITSSVNDLYSKHGKYLPPQKDFHAFRMHPEDAHYWHPEGKNHHLKLKDDKIKERKSDSKTLKYKDFLKKHGMNKTKSDKIGYRLS